MGLTQLSSELTVYTLIVKKHWLELQFIAFIFKSLMLLTHTFLVPLTKGVTNIEQKGSDCKS